MLPVAALLAIACGSSNPARPAISATQIDRMGRAGVNTALTDPFGVIPGMTADQAKDQYNAASDPAQWVSKFKGPIATHLAIYDFVSRCQGKQLAAGATVAAGRYDALAAVLADDQLYVRTSSSTCALYLAAEADATGLTSNNGDCGGRTPTEDTIKETLSLLFLGKPTGITDGLAVGAGGLGADDDGNGVNATTFPFLGNPN